MQRQIPARPSLEQYKKQAKELVKGGPSLKLADAQWRIAREHGFRNWTEFKKHIESPATPAIGITIPSGAEGIVVIPFASSSARLNPRYRAYAEVLNRAGFATAIVDLLSEEEELRDLESEDLRFDVRLLAERILGALERLPKGLRVGYLGFGVDAAAMLVAAAEEPGLVEAVVSCTGRADLAGPWLARIAAPCLFVSNANDPLGIGFHPLAMGGLSPSMVRMHQVVDSTQRGVALACDWFREYLTRRNESNQMIPGSEIRR